MGGSSSLNQKSQGAGYHVSGFLSEKVGRLKITKEQWEGYLAGLDDGARERAEAGTVFHCDAAHGKQEDGHLDANVCMFIGKAHASDIHPTGYWCGNDVYTQLNHAITVFEILHPGCKGLFLFDNSTGHSKMAEDALLAQNMNSGPGGKHVSKQRGTMWTGSDGIEHQQSFVFAAGDRLLFDAKNVRAPPLDGTFPVGLKVEVKRPGERKLRKGATVVSSENGKYTVSIDVDGRAEDEVLEDLDASAIVVPAETYKAGPIDARLVGQSKGITQILLERGVIELKSKLKAACGAKEKKARKDAKAEEGIGQHESVEVPKHAGWSGYTPCCLEFLLSEQPDFQAQQNAIQEPILSRGHYCIFLPKYHPELNFIERYWSRVKWYARQKCDQTKAGLRTATDEALSEKACDLALIRRYSRTAWRWVDAYRRGLDGVLACWAVRKSKCHRFVTDAVDREVDRMAEEQKEGEAARTATGPVEAPPLVVRGVADMAAVGALGDDDDD